MPLHQVTLHNFKSYKGTQLIGPFSPFCAIIGPNGSGKSNLMDAISFVLGMKDNARSEKVAHLIHKDCDSAYVQMELVVSDSSSTSASRGQREKTIVLMRSISSSGNSDYKMNGKSMTYADYLKELEEYNILVKAKNFLVFQGDIESIASQSPKDLTRLIQQISGSLELKQEHDELKELLDKATEVSSMNYTKKKEITFEIKQFRHQKEEALRYESLIQEKANAIQEMYLWKLFHFDKKSNETLVEIENLKYEMNSDEKINLESNLKEEKKKHGQLLKNLLKSEAKLKETEGELMQSKPQLLKSKEKVRVSTVKLETFKGNQKANQNSVAEQEKAIQKLETEKGLVEKAFDSFTKQSKEQLNQSKAKMSPAAESEYQEIRNKINQQTCSLNAKSLKVQQEYTLSKDVLSRLESQVELLNSKRKELQNASLKQELTQLTNEKKNLEAEIQQFRNESSLKNQQKLANEQRLSELNEKLEQTHSALVQLRTDKNQSLNQQKFREALNALMKAFPDKVFGTLTDCCKPVNKKYETAISVTLGKNMDSVIVDCQKTAVECIQYLRESRLGQATFLPLDTINPKEPSNSHSEISNARLAIDVLQFDPKFEKAVHYGCGNTLICDSVQVAKNIVYERSIKEFKCVALDGTVFHKTGMISGGESKSQTRKWQQKDLQNLQKSRDQLIEEIKEIKKKLADSVDDGMQLAALSSELIRINGEIGRMEGKQQSIDKELQQLSCDLKRLEPQLLEQNNQVEQLEFELERLRAEIKLLENGLLKDFCKKYKLQVSDLESTATKLKQEIEEKNLKFKNQLVKLDNQLVFEKQQLSKIKDQLEQSRQLVVKEKSNLDSLLNEFNELESERDTFASQISKLQAQIKELHASTTSQNQSIQSIKGQIQLLDSYQESANKKVASLEGSLDEIEALRESLLNKAKIEQVPIPVFQDSMENEIDYSSLTKQLKQSSEQQFLDRIASLTSSIEQMAPNLKALDKLDQVEEKLKQTNEEFEDARKEAKWAKETFAKVKQERFKRFNSAFTHISGCIDSIYKELTRSKTFPLGGTAYLNLEDCEEPYNEGIKFHAMPPMKRFRDMEQLSGGEKTVAALALLFAIHSYKPAPFFILDEVDAALDNTNVAKVANYIRSKAAPSFQFLVISLKPSFYEKANSLVGIYRDSESNGSKCLTLALDQFQ